MTIRIWTRISPTKLSLCAKLTAWIPAAAYFMTLMIASADHLAKGAKREKKALLVVTDGVDNESRESLEQAFEGPGR